MTLANPGNSILRSSLPEYVALLVYLGLFRSHFREQVNVIEYESGAFRDGSWNFEVKFWDLRTKILEAFRTQTFLTHVHATTGGCDTQPYAN